MPLGPPSLTYSSTCKALMSHVGDEVVLQVDRDYKAGALRVLAVCPNAARGRLVCHVGKAVCSLQRTVKPLKPCCVMVTCTTIAVCRRARIRVVWAAAKQQAAAQLWNR